MSSVFRVGGIRQDGEGVLVDVGDVLLVHALEGAVGRLSPE